MAKSEVCNFANDNTYIHGKYLLNHVLSNLKYDLQYNPSKFQFMVLGVDNMAFLDLNLTGKIIPCSSEVKWLGITIDSLVNLDLRKTSRTSVRKHLLNSIAFGE